MRCIQPRQLSKNTFPTPSALMSLKVQVLMAIRWCTCHILVHSACCTSASSRVDGRVRITPYAKEDHVAHPTITIISHSYQARFESLSSSQSSRNDSIYLAIDCLLSLIERCNPLKDNSGLDDCGRRALVMLTRYLGDMPLFIISCWVVKDAADCVRLIGWWKTNSQMH